MWGLALSFAIFGLGVLLEQWRLRKRLGRLERRLGVDLDAEIEAELEQAVAEFKSRWREGRKP